MQVIIELAMLPAVMVHVTELVPVATTLPLFSIVSEILMLPLTGVVEHVYITSSLASADGLSTVQVDVSATEKKQQYYANPQKNVDTTSTSHPLYTVSSSTYL